jgi:hypothetical protein
MFDSIYGKEPTMPLVAGEHKPKHLLAPVRISIVASVTVLHGCGRLRLSIPSSSSRFGSSRLD